MGRLELPASELQRRGVRYGQIMAEYSKLADTRGDETEQASMFAPFAGTEGYNPVAYVPYIVAAATGSILLLMRFFGLLAFMAAYAIAVTPVLKWAFLRLGRMRRLGRTHVPFANPYRVAGLSTRMRFRLASSGAHSASRSNNAASSGLSFSVGCGQSLAHTMRWGAAFA